MARRMASGDHAHRAVITTTTQYADGRESVTVTKHLGPYKTASVARGQITSAEREASQFNFYSGEILGRTLVVTGYVERAATVWERVDS